MMDPKKIAKLTSLEDSGLVGPWMPASEAPENVVVLTKIDDQDGGHNVQRLKRNGRLWFVPDGSTYVYYTPTHYSS